jgi:DNA-binding LacI/PurR family transcriptional regulator
MPVSLREVADRAGVARATVSSVLNGRGDKVRISSEAQARIRRAASELGYRPNRLAQGLGKGRTNIIGLMIAGLRNPFFLSLMEAAEERAFRTGFDVLPDSAFQLRASYEAEGKLGGWPMDGILIWVSPSEQLSDFLGTQREELPVVYLGYRRSDATDFVAIDREGGARQLMEHLWERGYRRVAYLAPGAHLPSSDPRFLAYLDFCQRAQQEPERLGSEPTDPMSIITQTWMREMGLNAGLELAARLPENRPDAVVCLNDLVAIGIYNGLRRGGLRVPEDIAVAGFDGIDEGRFLERPLTTVVSPGVALVERAFDVLTARLHEKDKAVLPPQQVTLPSELRLGETT